MAEAAVFSPSYRFHGTLLHINLKKNTWRLPKQRGFRVDLDCMGWRQLIIHPHVINLILSFIKKFLWNGDSALPHQTYRPRHRNTF